MMVRCIADGCTKQSKHPVLIVSGIVRGWCDKHWEEAEKAQKIESEVKVE